MGLNQFSKKNLLKWVDLICILLLLLFVYTATSKFLDYRRFVFQMRLAPVPLIKTIAPVLGWVVPSVELLIALGFAAGLFFPLIKVKALYAAVVLLVAFEIYIMIMLLSGMSLPCTCGGIISNMGWKQHMAFNGFFIITGILSIKLLTNHKALPLDGGVGNASKILSRA